jgi:hypothetical protein
MKFQKNNKKTKLILIALFILTSTALIPTLANAQSQMSIWLTTTEGPPGTSVSIIGMGFPQGRSVEITFGSTKVSRASPGMFGRINVAFQVPKVSPGTYTVTATSDAGVSSTATFTVTQTGSTTSFSNPTIWLNPAQGTLGTTINLSGAGFKSGESISINFGTANVATVSTDTSGAIKASFKVPSVSPGTYIVSATGTKGSYVTAMFPLNSGFDQQIPGNTTGYGNSSIDTQGFWTLPVIATVAVLACVFLVGLPFFIYRRRGRKEPLLEEESTYKPVTPIPSKTPSVPSRYSRSSDYDLQLTRRPTSPSQYNSPPRYNQVSSNMQICRNCKKPVKDYYSICPFCRKKLK